MPPLARSLLALAALLAAADARANPFCDFAMIGDVTDRPITFHLTVAGGVTTTIPDKCAMPGSELAGESINVCNTPSSKPRIQLALGSDLNFSPIYIDCPGNIPGCSSLDVRVTQFCKPAGLPPVGLY
ncbi:uncharacterized protein LOC133533792 [Cydia pomonella]|uniref:uncharacterized protein LOC133518398 n=1 Tax=Cydia pomonella TaxID=82600 RepID=UPI002ADD4775|nr:uncharacterized protein LOC133518398 [Cydia pomonella]XP_061728827.1 uncharacterized protein LOC133533792 [Cydia pomonella]